jgi:hypothetical protein
MHILSALMTIPSQHMHAQTCFSDLGDKDDTVSFSTPTNYPCSDVLAYA